MHCNKNINTLHSISGGGSEAGGRTEQELPVGLSREPGRAIGRDVAAGEAVEHELDAFISRRHDQRRKSEPEREAEAAWAAAEKRQEALRRVEADRGRLEWHRHLAGIHRGRMEHHEAAAERLQATERSTA